MLVSVSDCILAQLIWDLRVQWGTLIFSLLNRDACSFSAAGPVESLCLKGLQLKIARRLAALLTGLILLGCSSTVFASSAGHSLNANDHPAVYFLIVGKGKVVDAPDKQRRAVAAVFKVAEAAKKMRSAANVESLAENVMTADEYRAGETEERVTGAVFKERLRQLAATAEPEDTVIIYTHSHGRKNGFEDAQPLGGIVMDLPIRYPNHGGALLWDEYADLFLAIPAKNVVVLTMSCFSGGLVKYLDSDAVSIRWRDRRVKEHRNLVVMTSQNDTLTSDPIVKDGEVVNPFTYAVARALEGAADGFALGDKGEAIAAPKDGRITAGELTDFVMHTTGHLASADARHSKKADPRLTGSFNRADVLLWHE